MEPKKRLHNVQSVKRHTQERIICYDIWNSEIYSEIIAPRMPTKKIQKFKSCLSESIVFNTHFTMIVSGATMTGKTEWVTRLLAQKENMMIPVPKKVLFCYKCWQPSYTEMLKTMPEITF